MHSILVAMAILAGQVASADENLVREVRRLVVQLDASQLAQREAAEAKLLRLGPAVLDVLPPAGRRQSAEVQQRLGRIRQKLEQIAADAATGDSMITLHADAMPLNEILHAFQKQSGNAIIDYRQKFGQPADNPKLSVQFDKTAFWPALDQLLDQAGLSLYSFGQQRGLHVVATLAEKKAVRVGRASYSGPFRFEPLSTIAQRDLRTADAGSLTVNIEVAWEPRLAVILLMQRMADVQAVDQRGQPLPVADPAAQLEMPISGSASAVNLTLRFPLPSGGLQKIAKLQGKLLATIPGKTETFRFDKLAGAKNVEQRIAGATVVLQGVRKSPTGWEVLMRVRFDEAGDALASHRQWIFGNPAFLERAEGKPIAFERYETTAQSKNEVGLAFSFETDRPLDDLAFVYKTPGSIVTTPIPYELKDIKLPGSP
jgi:hypothetical protein